MTADAEADADAEWRRAMLEQWEWLQAQPWAQQLWWLQWFEGWDW